jgi:polar amino acid transport system substrate-binding protein
MKTPLPLLAALAFALALSAAPSRAATDWFIMSEELPPFNYVEDGVPKGFCFEVVTQIFAMADMPIRPDDVHFYPWARSYAKVQSQTNAVLFSMAHTDTRHDLFAWVGPLLDVETGIMAPKDKHIVITNPAHVGNLRLGTVRDGAPEQLCYPAGFPESSIERVTHQKLNIRKLEAGRIDMFAFNIPSLLHEMKRMGIDPTRYEVVYTLLVVPFCVAFHKDADPAVVQRLNRELAAFRQTPAYAELHHRYFGIPPPPPDRPCPPRPAAASD